MRIIKVFSGLSFRSKVWSEEARQAAAEARAGKSVETNEHKAANALMTVVAKGDQMSTREMNHVKAEVSNAMDNAQEAVGKVSDFPKEASAVMQELSDDCKQEMSQGKFRDALESSKGFFRAANAGLSEVRGEGDIKQVQDTFFGRLVGQ